MLHSQKPTPKQKVSVTIDANIEHEVRNYLSANPDATRSAVYEAALRLWIKTLRDAEDAAYYEAESRSPKTPEQEAEESDWSAIRLAAAEGIWTGQEAESAS